MPQEISADAKLFIDQIIEEKFKNASDNLKRRLFDDLYYKLSLYMLTVITKYLDTKDVKNLEELEKTGGFSTQHLQDLIMKKVPDAKNVIAKAMLEFRAIYINAWYDK